MGGAAMNMTIASFARPWRKFPRILMFYVTFGVLGAALLTFLHVQFPAEVATLPKPAPIENIPNLAAGLPSTSEFVDQARRIAEMTSVLTVLAALSAVYLIVRIFAIIPSRHDTSRFE